MNSAVPTGSRVRPETAAPAGRKGRLAVPRFENRSEAEPGRHAIAARGEVPR